jgi:hypothetical protein
MTQANGTAPREMYLRPMTFEVSSASKTGVVYSVTLPNCTCPDFAYRRTHNPREPFCKHLLAAYEMAGWRARPGTSGLDEATAVELLIDFRVPASAAGAAVRRARDRAQGTVDLPDGAGIAVIVFRRGSGLFDVELPGS